MFNFLSKFIQNASEMCAPLRELTKNNVEWKWTEDHTKCLNIMKKALSEAPTLKLFDNKLPIVVQCDASQNGLGACLMQKGRPITFTSRKLTEAEKRYPQIEKEFSAICYALEKFHQFIYGHEVTIQTDYKPLVSIVQKDIHKVTTRLQSLVAETQTAKI